MKKILIISWYYPPNSSIGAQRVKAFSEYLISKGFLVSVITSDAHKHDNEAVPNKLENIFFIKDYNILNVLKRKKNSATFLHSKNSVNKKTKTFIQLKVTEVIKSIIRNILYWPDASFLWFFKNKHQFKQIMEDVKPDIIFSSSTPHTCHLIGSYLAKQYNVPWVAEFRDLWSQNNVWQRMFPLNYCEAWFEKKVLQQANLLVTVSETLKDDLIQLHNKDVIKVMNGFNLKYWDPNYINKFKKDELLIRYTGKLYDGRRCPRVLFDALNELNFKAIKIRVEFYIPDPNYLNYLLGLYPKLQEVVQIKLPVSYNDSLLLQRTADINLLIEANTINAKGNLTGKLFEYICASRPILAIAHPESEIKQILNHTKAGELLITKDEIKEYLNNKIEIKKQKGICSLALNKDIALTYSRDAQFSKLYERLVQILNEEK